MDKNLKTRVYGAGFLFAFTVGFSFLGLKYSLSFAAPLEVLAFRYNFAFLGAVIYWLTHRSSINILGKPKGKIFLTSFFYVLFMILQAVGLLYATSVESGIIFAIIPVFTRIIASFLLGERGSWRQNTFMTVTITALLVMMVLGATNVTLNMLGAVILTLSSLSLAINNVLMRYVRDEYKPMEISFVISLIGFIVFNLASLISLGFKGDLPSYFSLLGQPSFLIATAYLGIACILISSWLMAYMTRHVDAVKAAIFGNLATAISIVAGVVFLSEPLYPYHIICSLFIIGGVIGVSASK